MPDEKHWTPDMLDSETDTVHTDPGGSRAAKTARNQEPLHLTLEDLLLRFSDINASLRVYRGPDGGAVWFGVRNSNGASFGPFGSWAETAPSILGVPAVARDDTAELRAAIKEWVDAADAEGAAHHDHGEGHITTDEYMAAFERYDSARSNLRRLAREAQ